MPTRSASADVADPGKPPAGVDPAPDLGAWQQAADKIRATSTWVMNAFIAVGAVTVGSGPLIGKTVGVNGWGWLTVTVGLLIAVFGVGIVIVASSNVMLPVYISDRELETADGTTVEIDAKRKVLTARQWERIDRVAADELSTAAAAEVDPDTRKVLQHLADRNNETAAAWNEVAAQWVRVLSYLRVRDRFHASRRGMFAGAALVCVGIGVYLAAVGGNPSATTDATEAVSPSNPSGADSKVRVFGWVDGSEPFREAVGMTGPGCEKVTVKVHGGSGTETDPWDVTTLPGTTCDRSVRFLVTSRYGVVSDPTPVVAQPDGLKPADPGRSGWATLGSVLVAVAVFVGVLTVVVVGVVWSLLWFNKRFDWGLVEPDPTDGQATVNTSSGS